MSLKWAGYTTIRSFRTKILYFFSARAFSDRDVISYLWLLCSSYHVLLAGFHTSAALKLASCIGIFNAQCILVH